MDGVSEKAVQSWRVQSLHMTNDTYPLFFPEYSYSINSVKLSAVKPVPNPAGSDGPFGTTDSLVGFLRFVFPPQQLECSQFPSTAPET